ncbi:MAG: OmpH family outer membrane protein [Gammaproteobacteria bacterium]
MMRRFSAAILVLAFAAAPVAMAAGNSTKVGLIDVQQVLAKSSAGQEVMQQIQGFGKQLQAKMGAKQDKLKKERDDIEKNAKIESKAQQEKAQQTFQTHVQSYQKQAQNARQSFNQKRASYMVPLQAKLNDVITAYAKRHGYDLILDSQAAVYNTPGMDITDAILKAFNKAQPHAPAPDTSAAAEAEAAGGGGQ